MKLGHVHLKVRNLERSLEFYRTYFGMEVSERTGKGFAFLSAGPAHHEIALQEVGEEAPLPRRYDVGLYHVAFEVPDQAAFAAIYRQLTVSGVQVYPIDHRISWALYFSDPDGIGLEVYWDRRGTEQGVAAWEATDRPLPAERILDFG